MRKSKITRLNEPHLKNQTSRSRHARAGEILARKHLQRNGYTILDTNWHTRWAELDIVATENDTLVFVEVKTRYSHDRGLPEEAITPQKLNILTRSAYLYKRSHPDTPDAMRIDFVGVDFTNSKIPRINLIKNISV